jgi:hypothetical protein
MDGIPQIVRDDAQAFIVTGYQFVWLLDDFAPTDGAVARAAYPTTPAPDHFALVDGVIENSGATANVADDCTADPLAVGPLGIAR